MSKRSIPIHEKKLNKRSRRKLTQVFTPIFDYMKSDDYMFASLLHPQPAGASSSYGEGEIERTMKKEMEIVEGAGHYLKTDFFLYAPLVDEERLQRDDDNIQITPYQHVHLRRRRRERETIKHMVSPNFETSSSPGKVKVLTRRQARSILESVS